MKGMLHKLIDPSQNAFVPRWNISDNILLAQELFSEYNQKRLPPRCALKVDLRKAYDIVEWGFLTATLKLFKFPAVFIHWVTECVSTASYSISLNGSVHGYFQAKAAWWSSRLSFAGRAQIIKSILGTLHNYWSSSFILSKGIMKCIESKLRSFLWKGCDGQGYAKVHWEQVCLHKESGGLGIKSVAATNAGLMNVILDSEWNWPDLRSIIVARILEELPVLQPPKDRITWPTTPSESDLGDKEMAQKTAHEGSILSHDCSTNLSYLVGTKQKKIPRKFYFTRSGSKADS
ncbi:UNVERIFIED_CONTAM: hypothetical protein Slati_2986500 [Sesamum latifolium]|uniref:Reverse transcriptase domain-containing protein n=1 Tax=Sesamum latifolium TaxID=2727402 RepID=A0AAW2VIU0_9LAMI